MMLYAAGSVHDVSVEAEMLSGLTWYGDLLWFADAGLERIVAVDPHVGRSEAVIGCPGLRRGLATMGGHLVYAAGPDYKLHIVDPASGNLIAETRNPRPGEEITGLEGSRQGLWVGYRDSLDLRSVADFSLINCLGVRGRVSGVTVTDRYVAYSDRPAENIIVVDPAAEQEILPINVHGSPTGLAWDGTRIWYCDNAHSRLRAIDVPGLVRTA